MSFVDKTPSNLKVAGTRDLASFSESVRKSDWSGNGYHILMAYIYAINYPYPNARVEIPHETLFMESKDMMWKLVIKFTCDKSNNNKFKIEFPGGEESYFNYIHEAIRKQKVKLSREKPQSVSHSNISSNISNHVKKTKQKETGNNSTNQAIISGKKKSKKHKIKPQDKKKLKNKHKQKGGTSPGKKKKPIKLFIMSGVFMGDEDCSSIGHFNIVIYDWLKKILLRIEPYGKSYSDSKIEKEFDVKLADLFRSHGLEVLELLKPSDYMSRWSFQWIEENKELKKGIGETHPSDAGGFCGVYATWMAHERFMYPYYRTEKLFKKMEDKIFGKEKMHNYIRNIAQHYLKRGSEILGDIKLKTIHPEKLNYLAEQVLTK